MSIHFTEDSDAVPLSQLLSSRSPENLAMEAMYTETFKIAFFCLIIDIVKYSRDK